MRIFVLGSLLLRTLNAQTDGDATGSLAPLLIPGTESPTDADISGSTALPTGTEDVILDSTTTDAEFGADETAGPGFTFPEPIIDDTETASIVVPVFASAPTGSDSGSESESAPVDSETDTDAISATEVATAVLPLSTDAPSDEDCPPSCYEEGASKLRRRQDVPSSSGRFAAFRWPGETAAAEDDGCADDIPEWLSESTGRKREACQLQQACPEKCYESSPGNSAQAEEGYGETTTEESYEETTTEEYYEDTTTEDDSEGTTTDEYSEDTTTEEYSEDTTTEEYYEDTTTDESYEDTTTEEYYEDTTTAYAEDTTTEEDFEDTTTEEYYEDTTTDEGYGEDTTTDEGYGEDTTTDEGYGEDTTTDEGYGEDTTTDEGYGDETTISVTGGYGGPTTTQTTFVTSTMTAEPYTPGGSGSEPGYTGSTIAGVCPQQCNPFDPAQNKCHITTSCTTTGNGKFYCACRAGFRASAWNPKDFTKQFKFAAQPYVYVAPGEVCDTVCQDQTCSEVILRPGCQ